MEGDQLVIKRDGSQVRSDNINVMFLTLLSRQHGLVTSTRLLELQRRTPLMWWPVRSRTPALRVDMPGYPGYLWRCWYGEENTKGRIM